jgi:hypothetical protein
MRKETAIGWSKVLPRHLLEALRKITKTSIMIIYVLAEIRTGHLTTTS